MKLRVNIFSICSLLMLGFIIAFSYSCTSFTDPYKPFISKKAPVYPAKVNNVLVHTSVDKVTFKIPKPTDPIVTKTAIFWNLGNDSLITEYPANKDTLIVEIDVSGGKNYSFNFYNIGEKGVESLGLNGLVFIPNHPPKPVKLDKSLWSNAKLPTDTWTHYSHYAFPQLWDNNATAHGHSFETTDWDELPMWFTINLGQKAKIISFIYYPQPHWLGEWPKEFQIWGSANPDVDPDHPLMIRGLY